DDRRTSRFDRDAGHHGARAVLHGPLDAAGLLLRQGRDRAQDKRCSGDECTPSHESSLRVIAWYKESEWNARQSTLKSAVLLDNLPFMNVFLTLVLLAFALQAPDPAAPIQFSVRLETTKGAIVIDVRREWAPHGADRLYALVKAGYYDDTRFFRVVQGRWAQFGINGDPALAKAWRDRT